MPRFTRTEPKLRKVPTSETLLRTSIKAEAYVLGFYEKRLLLQPLFYCMRAKRVFLGLVGGTSFLDFLEQMLLCIVEQQALVVRKVGFAPEILDKP